MSKSSPSPVGKNKDAERETKKKRLSMAVNEGIHICPATKPKISPLLIPSISVAEEQKKKSVRLKGIMKETRPATAHPSTTERSSAPPSSTRKINSATDISARRKRRKTSRADGKTSSSLPQKKTFAQVDADLGFPTGASISYIIENLVGMAWASKNALAADIENNNVGSGGSSKTNRPLVESSEPSNSVVTVHENIKEKQRKNKGGGTDGSRRGCVGGTEEDAAGLIGTAYDMFNAGLKFASGLIGNEEDLEPREDLVRYNGYTVRVCGRKLLLESLHVNCDFNMSTAGIYSRSNASHSIEALGSHTLSRERLEENCNGKRIRVVIRLNGPWSVPSVTKSNSNSLLSPTESDVANSIMYAEKHSVSLAEGKWTLIYGNSEEFKEKAENFVEITCPIGVNPASLTYGMLKGLLLVDAP